MCRSMINIQPATAEIRRGKKQEERKKQDKNIMSASATQGSIITVLIYAIDKPQHLTTQYSNYRVDIYRIVIQRHV